MPNLWVFFWYQYLARQARSACSQACSPIFVTHTTVRVESGELLLTLEFGSFLFFWEQVGRGEVEISSKKKHYIIITCGTEYMKSDWRRFAPKQT